MFKDTKAFSSFSVDDLEKAKQFYAQTLGLEVSETEEGLALRIAGGGNVFIYPRAVSDCVYKLNWVKLPA